MSRTVAASSAFRPKHGQRSTIMWNQSRNPLRPQQNDIVLHSSLWLKYNTKRFPKEMTATWIQRVQSGPSQFQNSIHAASHALGTQNMLDPF